MKVSNLLLPVCLLPLLLFAACGSDQPEVEPESDAAVDTTTSESDTAANDDTQTDGSAEGDTSDTTQTDAGSDTTGSLGATCASGADCDSGACLPVAVSGEGVCVARCATTEDCGAEERCIPIPGTDAESVCVSATLCVDLDGDRAGRAPDVRAAPRPRADSPEAARRAACVPSPESRAA